VLSRALLFPGPLPPASHFGLTLQRHAVATGLRYALHQLGRPLLEAAPVRLVRLRLYLDGEPLLASLGADPGARLLGGALLDPGGEAPAPLPAKLRAAVAFHRLRLLSLPRRLPAAPPALAAADPAALWAALRADLSRWLPATSDALLAELIASLRRRERRRRGESLGPVLSSAARAARGGWRQPLRRFGPPDPLRPSWARALDREAAARQALVREPLPPADPLRGRFRETYREALDRFSPGFLELARGAYQRGLLAQLDDAFFLPFETADDLASPEPVRWLEAAIAANRREYAALLQAAEPGDRLERADAVSGPPGPRAEWEWAPLLPLP
jgi:hypothetical protein